MRTIIMFILLITMILPLTATYEQLKQMYPDPYLLEAVLANPAKYHVPATLIDRAYRINNQVLQQWYTDVFTNVAKTEYYYSSGSNISQIKGYNWYTGAWTFTSNQVYTYNDEGLMSEMIFTYLSEGVWINANKYEYFYNENEQLDHIIISGWDTNWYYSSKTTYSYIDEMISEIVNQQYTNNVWVNAYKTAYTFNNESLVVQLLNQNWTNNAWVDSYKTNYNYDTESVLTGTVSQYYFNSEWLNASKMDYTYENNLNTTQLTSNWVTDAWTPAYLSSFTYDAHENKTVLLDQNWTNGVWVNSSKAFREYDEYNHNSNDITTPNPLEVSVYPNPFTSQTGTEISIKSDAKAQISIYNIKGEKVSEGSTSIGKFNWTGKNMPNGIYFIKVNTPGNQVTKKCLLIK